MYDIPAHVEHEWSQGQLDAYQSSMLGFPAAALGGNVDDLLVDASHAGASSATTLAGLAQPK